MKQTQKRAQMEIAGLLVIVILIILIIFFSLVFLSDKPKDPINIVTFEDTKMASQLGTVILETTTTCGTQTYLLRELAVDCALLGEINCGTESQVEELSCAKLEQKVKEILALTLDNNLEYELTMMVKNGVGENAVWDTVIGPIVTSKCHLARKNTTHISPFVGPQNTQLQLLIKVCS